MYVVIRRYNIAPGSADTIVQKISESFVPLISGMPGFVGWHLINPGDGTIASISIFEDKAGAEASTKTATEWVRQNLASVIRTAPVIVTGEVVATSGAGAIH
jgi:heme-degrading monooxygenase HmoA